MSLQNKSSEELRRMSEAELTQLGQESLMNRLQEQALEARAKHGSLSSDNLETFLKDDDCIRHPTRLVWEEGEIGTHQFAHPAPDYENPGGCVLYVRPCLAKRSELLALAVSYMIPTINYGEIINDEHCLEYGSTLQGMDKEEYYRAICEMADFTGAEKLNADEAGDQQAKNHSTDGGGCCHGGGCA